jgi:hypothetical protein
MPPLRPVVEDLWSVFFYMCANNEAAVDAKISCCKRVFVAVGDAASGHGIVSAANSSR